MQVLSDFHFIVHLALQHSSWFPFEDNQHGLPALCRAVALRDGVLASEFMQNPNWLSFCAAIESPTDTGPASSSGRGEFGTSSARCANSVFSRVWDWTVLALFDSASCCLQTERLRRRGSCDGISCGGGTDGDDGL